MNILLIAGHGQGDSGAIGNGYKEADLTREVVKLLKPQLSNYADVAIADTLTNWKQQIINKKKDYNFKNYDYVLEIHFNAATKEAKSDGKTKGTEIYITTSEKTHGIETQIVKGISDIGFKNRGVKHQNYSLIQYIKNQGVSAALLEVCFIDDIDDMKLYQSKKAEIIKAIAAGIINGFGLKSSQPEAVEILKSKIGLEQQTIDYLLNYKYGKELVTKIANAVK